MEDKIMLPRILRNNGLSWVDELFNHDYFPTTMDWEGGRSIPAVNISENEKSYEIEVAAPGLDKKDFHVKLENNVLTISSEKEYKNEEKDEKVLRKEFGYSSFCRSFSLPESVNAEKINASHKDGVLHVSVPKREEAKAKPVKEIKIA